MKKLRKRHYVGGAVVASLGVAGLVGFGVSQLVLAAQRQQNVEFVDIEPYEPERYFSSDEAEPPTEVRPASIANNAGWVVNKGPVRVTSAYKNLFDQNTLVEFAEWVYRELPWGANGQTLNTINFTTGVDNSSTGGALGAHAGGRDVTGIYISPDGFESNYSIAASTFRDFLAAVPPATTARAAYAKALTSYIAAHPMGPVVPSELETQLIAALRDQPISLLNPVLQVLPEYRTHYAALSADQVATAMFNPADVTSSAIYQLYQGQDRFMAWAETAQRLGQIYIGFTDNIEIANGVADYLASKQATWARVMEGNYLAPGVPGNELRVLAARAKDRMPAFFAASTPRYAFDAALAMVKTATTTYSGPDNTIYNYEFMAWLLYEFLADVMFAPDTTLVESVLQLDGTRQERAHPTYTVRPVSAWDAAWVNVKAQLVARYANPALLAQQEAAYQLFKHCYQYALTYYTDAFSATSALTTHLGAWVGDKIQLLQNYFTSHIAKASAPERIQFMLTGTMPEGDALWRTREDAALGLITAAELAAPTTTRRASLRRDEAVTAFLRAMLEDDNLLVSDRGSGIALRARFRRDLLNAMRYTIAHEYGHHETMWQTYGDYPQSHEIYSVDRAARPSTIINAALFDRLDAIGKATGGLKNAVDIAKRANDKYSATWTPTYQYYDEHHFVGPALDAQGHKLTPSAWVGFTPGPYYSIRDNPTFGLYVDELLNGTVPRAISEPGVDDFRANPLGDWMGANSRYLYVVNPNDARINGRLSTWALFLFNNRLSSTAPGAAPVVYQGNPLRLSYSLGELLWAYQLAIWARAGKDAAWERAHGFRLPRVGANQAPVMTQKGTVRYAVRLDKYGLETALYYQFFTNYLNATKAQIDGVIAALDALIDRYYDKLVAQYPNFFEAAAGLPAMSAYERNVIATATVMRETKALLANQHYTAASYPALLRAQSGVYFDPMTPHYQKYQDLLAEDDLWDDFGQKDQLVTDGTVTQRRALTSRTDYTGEYSEFLTRAWNQLAYRPVMANYLDTGGATTPHIDLRKYRAYEQGWIDDTTRFQAQGAALYNYDLRDPAATPMTEVGGKLLMWFREVFGVGSSLDLTQSLPRTLAGELDFAALDAALVRPNTVEKIYRNPKTERLGAWGWFTAAEAARYKYLVFENADGSRAYVPLRANAHTSNYFYYTDLTRAHRRAMFPGFVQWVADPFIFGKYANAALKVGTSTIYFSDRVGGALASLASTTTGATEWRTNNDYERVIAEVIITVIPAQGLEKGRVLATTRAF